MIIYNNFSLKKLNTFGIDVISKYFVSINNIDDLNKIFDNYKLVNLPKLILGGGSNILFTKNFEGLIIKNYLKKIEFFQEKKNNVIIKCASGENWNDIVIWAIKNNLGGLENLSDIPGTAGAAVVQNIGAYGVEIKDFLLGIEVYDIKYHKIFFLSRKKFWLNYRNSSFKNELKNKYFITSIFLILKKKYTLNISYDGIIKELKYMNISNPDIKHVSKAIHNIRFRKLVNPEKIGNAGSFFKNPIISIDKLRQLIYKYPDIKYHSISKNKIKLFGGQLIEKIGWKGKRIGEIGIYDKQSLILLNYGNGNGKEIYSFSKKIIENVKKKFDIVLEREVIIV